MISRYKYEDYMYRNTFLLLQDKFCSSTHKLWQWWLVSVHMDEGSKSGYRDRIKLPGQIKKYKTESCQRRKQLKFKNSFTKKPSQEESNRLKDEQKQKSSRAEQERDQEQGIPSSSLKSKQPMGEQTFKGKIVN